MAGAGWRDFVPGEVLTAANVQDYLQDQAVMSFASAAARTSAIASPTDGMVSYLKDSDMVEIYNGSAWTRYGGGLVPVSPSSVAVAGGTATVSTLGVVEFTGATTSISLNGVFTSAYENYRILFRVDTASSGGSNANTRLRASGTDATGANYDRQAVYVLSTNAPAVTASNGATSWGIGDHSTTGNHAILDIFRPALATSTSVTYSASGFVSGASIVNLGGLRHNLATAYDGITFTCSSGTFTGKAQVFGYND